MASGCCGRGGCTCVIEGGAHISVTGSGSAGDPLVLVADFDFDVVDNDTFELSLTGAGTEDSPYRLEVEYASTAKISDLPDVSDTTPSNGQVLVFNTGTGLWTPGSPTPAASGSVLHDTSLSGDGSMGTPLEVVPDADRFVGTSADGVGLTDDGVNSLVRRFVNEAARTAADPAPDLNTVSVLDSAPGLYDRWDGAAWVPLEGLPVVSGGELLALSGSYDGGRVVQFIKQVAVVTDINGKAQLLSGGDFTGTWGTAAGVLSAVVQPTGTVRFDNVVAAQPGYVELTAYQAASSAVMASQALTMTVVATFYV